jgi:hypothetical protein
MRRQENPIRKTTTGKGANYRPTKSGAGMTAKGVKAYRAANPGSKLKTAVTGKVKKGSKAANRRKSYCARSLGQLKRSSAKTRNDPNSRIKTGTEKMEMLNEQRAILDALRAKYEAEIAEADAIANIYLENSVGIGEHPQHLEEVNKQIEKIANAKEKLDVLDEFEPEKGTTL